MNRDRAIRILDRVVQRLREKGASQCSRKMKEKLDNDVYY